MKRKSYLLIGLISILMCSACEDRPFSINGHKYHFPYAQVYHIRKNNFELARFTTDQFYPIVFSQSTHVLNAEKSNLISGNIIYLEFYNSDSTSLEKNYTFNYYINSESELHKDRDLTGDSIIDNADIYEALVPNTAIIDLDNSFYAFNVKTERLEDLIYSEQINYFRSGDIKIKQLDTEHYQFKFNCSGNEDHKFKGNIDVKLCIQNVDLYVL